MSKAFDEWWQEQSKLDADAFARKFPSLQDAAREGWNACAKAAVNILDSAQDDFGAMGNDKAAAVFDTPIIEVRALAAEEK